MRRTALVAVCACASGLLAAGCKIPTLKSTDVMYGPDGGIVKMKSPDRKMKIKVKGDEVTVKGARGIGGQPRMAPLPVETGGDVGIRGVQVPPPAGPVLPGPGVIGPTESVTEEGTVVQ